MKKIQNEIKDIIRLGGVSSFAMIPIGNPHALPVRMFGPTGRAFISLSRDLVGVSGIDMATVKNVVGAVKEVPFDSIALTEGMRKIILSELAEDVTRYVMLETIKDPSICADDRTWWKTAIEGHAMLPPNVKDMVKRGTFLSEEETAELAKALEKASELYARKKVADLKANHPEYSRAVIKTRDYVVSGDPEEAWDGPVAFFERKVFSPEEFVLAEMKERGMQRREHVDVLVNELESILASGIPRVTYQSIPGLTVHRDGIEIAADLTADGRAAALLMAASSRFGDIADAYSKTASANLKRFEAEGFGDEFREMFKPVWEKALFFVNASRETYMAAEDIMDNGSANEYVALAADRYGKENDNKDIEQEYSIVRDIFLSTQSFLAGKVTMDEHFERMDRLIGSAREIPLGDIPGVFYVRESDIMELFPDRKEVMKTQLETVGRIEGCLDNGDGMRYLLAGSPEHPGMLRREYCSFVLEQLDAMRGMDDEQKNFIITVDGKDCHVSSKEMDELSIGNGVWLKPVDSLGESIYAVCDISRVPMKVTAAKPYEEAIKDNLMQAERNSRNETIRRREKEDISERETERTSSASCKRR